MANASSITGHMIRVTRLDASGGFATGTSASYTTKAFISFSFTPEYEEGDEFTQKGASGTVCATFKAPDTLKRVNLSVAICDPDTIFTEIIAGGSLLGTNGDGWAAPVVGEDPTPNGVAIEVWSNRIIDGKPASDGRHYHWVFPYAKMREGGERVVQNDILATEFEGWGVGNTEFGNGPDGSWAYPTATNRPYMYARTDTAPTEEGLSEAAGA